ncbi:MAG: MFS transporter [Pseudomonadales bacterium]|nr:MFS transporter [Pseudomonadales bacterium]
MSRTPQEVIDQSPMSVLQVTVVVMCVLLNALDGFDVLSISFASPGISAEWGIERAGLGFVLSMELFGMAFGSFLLGRVADQYGRRPTILGCLVVMSVGMLAAAYANSVTELSVYRLFTGLGIGGMLAATNAMTAEFSNNRHRALAVIVMASGYPLGAIVGGAIASDLLISYDWRAVFHFGAVMTAVFFPLVWFFVPESVVYLAQRDDAEALSAINKMLRKMKHELVSELPNRIEKVSSSTRELFVGTLKSKTTLLTLAYFAHIMTFYFIIKWIPKLVVDMGFHPSEAGGVLVWANVGGLAGSLLLGLLSLKFPVKKLILIVLVGSVVMVSYFGQGQNDLVELAFIAGAAGFFTNGAIVGMYYMFTHVFPTHLRAGGTGFVIGVGRGGATLGPIVAGLMFALGYGLDTVAVLMATGSVVCFVALSFLRTES